jgi:C-terminal processing protease CtpA/Prc
VHSSSEKRAHVAQLAAPPAVPPPPPSAWQRLAAASARRAAAALLAAALVTAPPLLSALPAAAVTNEQLLFLEAWRAVDRAYVDKKFNGQNWFKVREDALKGKLTTREDTYAAVRQLLASLGDPFTRFLDPDQYGNLRCAHTPRGALL